MPEKTIKRILKIMLTVAIAFLFLIPSSDVIARISQKMETALTEEKGNDHGVSIDDFLSDKKTITDNTKDIPIEPPQPAGSPGGGDKGRGRMIYVDDDRPWSWYDATHKHTIQEGVDTANNGDTVFVYNGTYYENVEIANPNQNSINLIGENKTTTTLIGSLNICTEDVTVDGFTIEVNDFLSIGSNDIFTNNIVIINVERWVVIGSSNIIRGNMFTSVDASDFILYGYDNVIYDNFFCNMISIDDQSSEFPNRWNISKTPGTNIIGGAFLGGNYWSNYHGGDMDADGLGDINLPYNDEGRIHIGGDFLPLTNKMLNYSYVEVDDDFNVGTEGFGEYRFNTIQEGVYAVREPGVVYVYNGNYNEHVIVERGIDVIGEDRNNTIVDAGGEGYCFHVIANGVTIRNFTIQHAGPGNGNGSGGSGGSLFCGDGDPPEDHAGIELISNHNHIYENVIKENNGWGIWLKNSDENEIEVNFFNDNCNNYENIYGDEESDGNNVVENTIVLSNNLPGIHFKSSYNTICRNNVLNSFISQVTGISLSYGQGNVIEENTVSNCNYGVFLTGSINTSIKENMIINEETNGLYGISLSGGQDNVIEENTVSNYNYGVFLTGSINTSIIKNIMVGDYCGIEVQSSVDTLIKENTIAKEGTNGENGISLSQGCSKNVLSDNHIENYSIGIFLSGEYQSVIEKNTIIDNINSEVLKGIWLSLSHENVVQENTIEYPNAAGMYGIYIESSNSNVFQRNTIQNALSGFNFSSSDQNTVSGNTIHPNTLNGQGIYIEGNSLSYNITDNIIDDGTQGIFIQGFSSGHLISGNTIMDNSQEGILITADDGAPGTWNTITENSIQRNRFGIKIMSAEKNSITNNNVSWNNYGIYLCSVACENYISQNKFFNNSMQAYDLGSNIWNNSYPYGGNYWNDYIGVDVFIGPAQNQPGSDGIWDSPYNISGGTNRDMYPLAIQANAHSRYMPVNLGVLRDANVSTAYAINNIGLIAGSSGEENGVQKAFIYDSRMLFYLGVLGEGLWSDARAINDTGSIVGSTHRQNPNWLVHAFVWNNGVMTDLGALGGENCTSYGYGSNNLGQVVGTSYLEPNQWQPPHAFLWQNNQMVDLGELPGDTASFAYAINDNGQVVGTSSLTGMYGTFSHAFLWNATQEMTALQMIPGDYISIAYAINNNGVAAGYSESVFGKSHAILWNSNGTPQDLGDLGGNKTCAYDVNISGSVVGSSCLAGDKVQHAFLWEEGEMKDLNDLIPSDSGWELIEAYGISDKGEIVGYGKYNGIIRGFVLVFYSETFTIDIDVDSDNDNDIGSHSPSRTYEEEAIEENLPGKFIIINDDDDDKNRIPDLLQNNSFGSPEKENDLIPLILELRAPEGIIPSPIPFNVSISFASYFSQSPMPSRYGPVVRVWRSPNNGETEEIVSGTNLSYNILTSDPIILWLEGQNLHGYDPELGGTADITCFTVKCDFNKNGIYEPNEIDIIRTTTWTPRKYVADGVGAFFQRIGLPPGYDVNDPNNFQSRGWSYRVFRGPGSQGDFCLYDHIMSSSPGFPLNIALAQGYGPGDFPPVHLDPELSSAPLVSKEVSHFQGQTPYVERPVHNDIIDMITGVPLSQEIDFELPFGSATFRHVRTYSESFVEHMWRRRLAPQTPPAGGGTVTYSREGPEGAFWDWNGLGTMMSENPILLIDARYPELTNFSDPDDVRCYFIPDAHHMIPFTYVRGTNPRQYTAPSWFDAILLHNGNATNKATEFYVWLNRKTIKYTFEVHEEDTEVQYLGDQAAFYPSYGEIIFSHYEELFNVYIDSHNPLPDRLVPPNYEHYAKPSQPGEGWGVPFYGVVAKIEDKYGNTVEYEYCDFHQYACDDPSTPEVVEFCQNANEKGQIKSIKLRVADGTVAWTLLYSHRGFAAHQNRTYDPAVTQATMEEYNHHALHSIHVYQGDVDTSSFEPTLGFYDYFANITSFDAYDQIVNPTLPSDKKWVLEVKYLYEEIDPFWYWDAGAGTPYHNYLVNDSQYQEDLIVRQYDNTIMDAWPYDEWSIPLYYWPGYLLLKTTVTTCGSREGTASVNLTSHTINRYQHWSEFTVEAPSSTGGVSLKAVYYDTTINAIVEAKRKTNGENVNENIIFELADDNLTVLDDNSTTTLLDAADIQLIHWTKSEYDSLIDCYNPAGLGHKLIRILGSDPEKTFTFSAGVQELVDHRTDSDHRGHFTYYLLKTYDVAGSWGECLPQLFDYHAEYHFPYRYYADPAAGIEPHWAPIPDWLLKSAPWDQPFFNMIIDEHLSDANGNDLYDPLLDKGIVSRRVVKMNPAGFILEDTTWMFENNSGQIVNHTGFSERREYNEKGQLLTFKTKGWSAEENQPPTIGADPEHHGLVYVYTYENDYTVIIPMNGGLSVSVIMPGELAAVGIQEGNGSDQTVYYIERYEHTNPSHQDLVTKQVKFPVPTTDRFSNDGEITITTYEYNIPGYFGVLVNKTVIKPPLPQTKDGPLYYSVQKENYDKNGNLNWSGYGCSDIQGNPIHEFYVDHKEYDIYGRPLIEIVDVDDSFYNLPEGFVRISSTSPLNLTTRYVYYDNFISVGCRTLCDSKKILPNGKEEYYLFRGADVDWGLVDRWIYNDVVWLDKTDPEPMNWIWKVLSPVTILHQFGSGHIQWMKEVILNETSHTGEPNGVENYTLISTSIPKYDTNGQIIGWKKIGENGQGVKPSLETYVTNHATGQPERSQSFDGTITRYVYNFHGYLEETYQGTSDYHPVWGMADPWDTFKDPNWTMNPSDNWPEMNWTDNMRLTEKRYYGEGTTNADKLIAVRHYNSKPMNQYFQVNETGVPIPAPNNEDEIGWTENYSYDWRMRQVLIRSNDEAGSPLKYTLTWYDNLNRVTLEATYGPVLGVPSGVDPRFLQNGWNLTPANITQLLTAPVKPVTLTETVYNNRGLVAEKRQYNVSSGSQALYLSEMTFYNHKDKTTETRKPNAPIEQYTYDAKDREVKKSLFAGGLEISRTETINDLNDWAIKTVNWERRHDATGTLLTNDNSVKTYAYKWYDEKGREIAQAAYGANNPDDIFATGPTEPLYDPSDPPMPGEFSDVMVVRYEYDNNGQQNATMNPDRTVTRTEFDDLGRKLLLTENADDRDNNDLLRHTAYLYHNKSGLLLAMAAVTPDHRGLDGQPGLNGYTDINWTANDNTIQVTRFEYNATVVNGSWILSAFNHGWTPDWLNFDNASMNKGWISKVIYPEGDTFTFTYYPDGTVASRTDSKGVTFFYVYDEIGRLNATFVNDTFYYNPTGSGEPSYAPTDRVQKITYTYESDDLTKLVTAFSFTSGAESVVSQNLFVYDGSRNLIKEWQAQNTAVNPLTTIGIDYVWTMSPAGNDNTNRLSRIVYPGVQGDSSRRIVTFHYDGAISNNISRITSIQDSILGIVASYMYTGSGGKISTVLGNGVTQTVINDLGLYSGLDQFGRITNLQFTKNTNTLEQYQYGYDDASNRIYSRVKQLNHDNDRSFLYEYDALNRLIDADMGRLAPSNTTIIPAGVPSTDISWDLDNLGNWAGGNPTTGSMVQQNDTNGDGVVDQTYTMHHTVNNANQITNLYTNGVLRSPFVYDRAGSLVFDGSYLYQYDGFNRLVQVNHAGLLSAGSFDSDGRIVSGPVGALVAKYTYDGLGRLIKKETSTTQESYFYDCVRRLQEVITTGSQFSMKSSVTKTPSQTSIKITKQTLQERATIVSEPRDGTTVKHEYIYGPSYVDEFIVQIDENGNPFYMLQDASFNVVALTNAQGNVAVQYTYSPYGQLLALDEFSSHPVNRVGHQGLFFENFNGNGIGLNTVGLYYNRNRWYSPSLGRFMQRDPNEAGQPINTALQMNAQTFEIALGLFDSEKHYQDGMNLYQSNKNNPIIFLDPKGLFGYISTIGAVSGLAVGLMVFIGYYIGQQLRAAEGLPIGGFTQGIIGFLACFATVLSIDLINCANLIQLGINVTPGLQPLKSLFSAMGGLALAAFTIGLGKIAFFTGMFFGLLIG